MVAVARAVDPAVACKAVGMAVGSMAVDVKGTARQEGRRVEAKTEAVTSEVARAAQVSTG